LRVEQVVEHQAAENLGQIGSWDSRRASEVLGTDFRPLGERSECGHRANRVLGGLGHEHGGSSADAARDNLRPGVQSLPLTNTKIDWSESTSGLRFDRIVGPSTFCSNFAFNSARSPFQFCPIPFQICPVPLQILSGPPANLPDTPANLPDTPANLPDTPSL
jgi:hypothetical protein